MPDENPPHLRFQIRRRRIGGYIESPRRLIVVKKYGFIRTKSGAVPLRRLGRALCRRRQLLQALSGTHPVAGRRADVERLLWPVFRASTSVCGLTRTGIIILQKCVVRPLSLWIFLRWRLERLLVYCDSVFFTCGALILCRC